MPTSAFLLFLVQACLIQDVFSACYGASPAGAYGWGAGVAGPYGIGAGIAAPCAYGAGFAEPFGYAGYADYGLAAPYAPSYSAYGGAGVGNVAVAGELPVGGATAVAGQVPIMGAVEYGGPVSAAGTVSISGSCACGCGGPYMY